LHHRILAIEAAASRAWPPIEREALHGWLLRYGRAGSRRLNSVQTLEFGPGTDLDESLAVVERWYQARQLPSCFQLNDAVRPTDLDAVLNDRGYERITPTSVMIANELPAIECHDLRIEILPHADARVLRAITDPSWPAEKKDERVDLFARLESPHVFALVMEGGDPIAGGMCAVDGQLAGLFSMRTQAAHRGRGLARAVALRLMRWAREQGVRQLYLQVEDDNAPALHLYRQLGFERVYGYHYREKGVGD